MGGLRRRLWGTDLPVPTRDMKTEEEEEKKETFRDLKLHGYCVVILFYYFLYGFVLSVCFFGFCFLHAHQHPLCIVHRDRFD